MENRYVYRRVEDGIGSELKIPESPHSHLTRELRHALRELRDISHNTEISAICLSAMAGNGSVDISKANEKVLGLLDRLFSQMFPYFPSQKEEKEEKPENYDMYFSMLEEMDRKTASGNSKSE